VSRIKEFNSEALELRGRNKLTLVIVDDEILASIDKCEILRSLNYQVNAVLNIEHERRCPVHHVVNIALSSSANNQMIVFHAHIDNTLPKVQVLIHLMQTIVDTDFVIFIKDSFNVSP